jgi:NADH-quinone oxidoreductase subunit L
LGVNLADLLQPLPFTSLTALAAIVLLLPLLSFGLLAFFDRLAPNRKAHGIAIGIFILNTLLSAYILYGVWQGNGEHSRFHWFEISSGGWSSFFTLGISLNRLAGLMLLLVNFIALLVQLFSVRYMEHEKGYNRYFAFLGLFAFAMLGIVMADNLLMIFIFWELVGLSSYLLIGFWFRKATAAAASKKAFLVNRVGDIGFLLGMLILFAQFGTLDLAALQQLMPLSELQDGGWFSHFQAGSLIEVRSLPAAFITLAGLGLFCGAVGKSAQFPLLVWLPDAMEGPTPVSALIHAATMVAAGVYLLARVFVFLSPEALNVIAFMGAITAFMGAFAAFSQHDIKRVLAFSTISQLGYMVMGMGVGAYSASLFHLFTHAFFKACLFLASGAIIYALHEATHRAKNGFHFDAQDMRFMGGLRHKMPVTYGCYLVAMLALAGLPFFSGFLSKDAILAGTWGWASVSSSSVGFVAYLVPLLGFASALMTALYMGRQLVLVFYGRNRLAAFYEKGPAIWHEVREVPLLMQLPLLLLAFLSLGPLFSLNPFNSEASWLPASLPTPQPALPGSAVTFEAANRLYEIQEAAHHYHSSTAWLSVILVMAGLVVAYLVYYLFNGRGEYYTTGSRPSGVLGRLSARNWHLDELYEKTFIAFGRRSMQLASAMDRRIIDPFINFMGELYIVSSHVLAWFDRTFIDGFISSTVWLTGRAGLLSRSIQGGKIQSYLLLMLLGLLAVLLWMLGS